MSCTQEKYEARQKAKPGWQEQKPAASHLKAMLLAKLKLKKFAAAARAEQERSRSSIRETLEISDDEASPLATAPLPPIPPSEVPAVAEAAKVADAPQELLTRTQQLSLANSKKRKNKKKDDDEDLEKDETKPLRKKCLSKCGLSIARKRSKAKVSQKQAKRKAKAKSCPKPKASAKAKAVAAKPHPKAKARAQIRLPNASELRHYHGLTKKFKQAREGVFYGDVPKEERGVLRDKIHVSKKFP